ncbi:MAG: sensor histidine kinase [Chloroflexota bacterium]|nr:sensor histidine kinase [Chloroflexota bacterium]
MVAPAIDQSPFRDGDLVVAMDGRPVEAWIRDVLPFGAGGSLAALGPVVQFDVVRDGQPIRIAADRVAFPAARIADAPLGLVTFGTGVLILATALLARRPRSTVLRLLFVGSAANVGDIVPWVLGLEPTDVAAGSPFLLAFIAATIFNVIFWSTILHILTIYPVRSPLAIRNRAIVPLMYAAPIGVLVGGAVITWLAGGSVLERVDRLASVVGTVASGMLVAILIATIAGYRRASPQVRRSVRFVAITLGFAAVATLGLLTLPIALRGSPLVDRSTVAILALPVPIAMAVAVLRDRLFQVALLTRSRERVVAAREDERRKLRRDLHDGLAPTLAALGLQLDHARQLVREDPAGAEEAIAGIRTQLRAAIADIRRLSRELRPPALDALGLVGAIRQQADGLGSPLGSGPVIIVADVADLPKLSAAVEVAAYRIAVEAMMNAVRHAAAATCRVRIALAGDVLEIEVADDGAGMTGAADGVGTRSMLERAAEVGGDVRVEQGEDGGTRVIARLPVDLSPTDRAHS